jgi:hypothetical protein
MIEPMLTPEERRRRIRAKVDAEQLSGGDAPHGGQQLPSDALGAMVVGTGSGAPCAACDEPIGPEDVQVTDGGTRRLHGDCDAMWREERERPKKRKG